MIDKVALYGKIASSNLTYKYIAKELKINPVTFKRKLDKGLFNNSEIDTLSNILKLDKKEMVSIFFKN